MSKKKEQAAVTPEEKAPEVLSFEDFLANKTIHPGLVASFSFEARTSEDGLNPRTEAEWIKAFEDQSNRTY